MCHALSIQNGLHVLFGLAGVVNLNFISCLEGNLATLITLEDLKCTFGPIDPPPHILQLLQSYGKLSKADRQQLMQWLQKKPAAERYKATRSGFDPCNKRLLLYLLQRFRELLQFHNRNWRTHSAELTKEAKALHQTGSAQQSQEWGDTEEQQWTFVME